MATPSTSQTVSVGGRTIKLTNLDKVLYPATGTTKADVIAYYAGVAEVMLPHLVDRPATRKRWPDGVGEPGTDPTVFFNKDLGAGTPDWVERRKIVHRDHDNHYPVVNDLATLTWLAQLAALELHVPQWRFGRNAQPRNPDRLVLDLDPGEGVTLAECAEVARWARDVLTDVFGGDEHAPVPVTSGSQGIHLYVPLDGSLNPDQVTQVARELARALEAGHRDTVISSMRRSDRDGKVFIDWSQNNGAKTTVAPYSLRGRTRPTVAAPRTWDELAATDLHHLDHQQVLSRVLAGTDPFSSVPGGTADVDASDRLSAYRSMRDARRTPEPVPERGGVHRTTPGDELTFVIQEHHARALHYDVRLERDGVLVSWAVPKGPPTAGSSNHLAVQTEDHPMEYADFAGAIPRGEYGGGSVSIWDSGTYRLHKWRDGQEVIATLFGRPGGGLGGVAKFALIHTGGGAGRPERNWLMHRMDTDPEDLTAGAQPTEPTTELPATVSPMRAGKGTVSRLDGDDWTFEMEWVGDRVTIYLAPSQARVYDTTGADRTEELTEVVSALVGQTTGTGPLADGAVLDGVLVGGRTLVLFDLMRLGRRSLLREPYRVRREVLTKVIHDADGAVVQVPPGFDDDHDAALTAAAELGLPGVIAKKISSTYQPGRIARTWQRIAVPTGTSPG